MVAVVAVNDDADTPGPEEWNDHAATVLDGNPLAAAPEAVPEEFSDQVTRASDIASVLADARAAGREAGCAACFTEGQEDAIGALRSLMFENGAANDEVAATVAHVRLRLTKL